MQSTSRDDIDITRNVAIKQCMPTSTQSDKTTLPLDDSSSNSQRHRERLGDIGMVLAPQ